MQSDCTNQSDHAKERLWVDLDALGVDEVRERVDTLKYGNPHDIRAFTAAWLRQKEIARFIDINHMENPELFRAAQRTRNAALAAATVAVITAFYMVAVAVAS